MIHALTQQGIAQSSLPTQDNDEGTLIELSPFEVSTEQDSGYAAAETLAGTRIRSSIKNFATSITVVNQQFLEDTNADNLEDLLVYTAGTEIAGAGGNYTNPGGVAGGGGLIAEAFADPIRNTRVRGLAEADLTRDFFASSIGFDAYNTQRVAINRGANSILFGLGSPAGIINNTLIKPIFEDHAKVQFNIGAYGSQRYSLDIERVIMEDKLSVRGALLYEDEEFKQDPAYERDERAYGVVTYKPFRYTTIRATFETGSINANRPRQLPPEDELQYWFDPSFWYDVGADPIIKGTHTPLASFGLNSLDDGTPAAFYFGPIANTFAPALIFDEPNITGVDSSSHARGLDGYQVGALDVIHPNFPIFLTIRGTSQGLRHFNPENPDYAYYTNRVITDDSIFDFRNKLIDGPNKHEYQDFKVTDLTIQQLFLDGNAGIDYTYHKEESDYGRSSLFDDGSRYGNVLQIDVNPTYINGDPNPNLGRVFTSFSGGKGEDHHFETENHRITPYISLDLGSRLDNFVGKIIGKQNLTFLYEQSEQEQRDISRVLYSTDRQYADLQDNRSGVSGIINKDFRTLGGIVYLGSSLLDAPSAAGANLSNLQNRIVIDDDNKIATYDVNAGQFVDADISTVRDLANGASLSRNELTSQAVVLQNEFLDGIVFATVGWRKDDIDIWQNSQPPRGFDNRVLIDETNFSLPDDPTSSAEVETFSWSTVVHLPPTWTQQLPYDMGLSVHYGESENNRFSEARRDLYGNIISPPSGTSTEYGFTVSFLNDKVSFRANWYETIQAGASVSEGPPIINEAIAVDIGFQALREDIITSNPYGQGNIEDIRNYPALPAAIVEAYNIKIDTSTGISSFAQPPGLSMTSDLVSKGFELEVYANITPQWSLHFNAARQEVSRDNTGPSFKDFFEERSPIWENYGTFPASPDGEEDLYTRLFRRSFASYLKLAAQDGSQISDEVRKWRWNLISTYRFNGEGFLRQLENWRIGGALRWQDKVAIGYPLVSDPDLGTVPDVNNPFYGETDFKVDGWIGYERELVKDKLTMDIQLSVRNLFNDDDLIPVIADPDGRTSVYRIPEARTWEIITTLRF
jgi:hypothetical protein